MEVFLVKKYFVILQWTLKLIDNNDEKNIEKSCHAYGGGNIMCL